MGGKGEGFSGTCIKQPWTKPKGGRIKGGKWGWLGWGGMVAGKQRPLNLNNNKKCEKNKSKSQLYVKNRKKINTLGSCMTT